jgi:hypothetical protein
VATALAHIDREGLQERIETGADFVLVFHHGVSSGLFGFAHVDSIEAWVPLFLFSVLFGLSMTLAELVEAYLAQHGVDSMTIEKLRWLLGKAVAIFGDRPVGELRSQEIAAWRIALSPGYLFDATQALRQALNLLHAKGVLQAGPIRINCGS